MNRAQRRKTERTSDPSLFRVGDPVVVVQPSLRGNDTVTETTVAQVGRKYAYANGFTNVPFNRVTGRQEGRVYGYGLRLYTPAGWAERQRRNELEARIVPNLSGWRRLSTDQLAALADLLDGGRDERP